jgi:hypothetical protein
MHSHWSEVFGISSPCHGRVWRNLSSGLLRRCVPHGSHRHQAESNKHQHHRATQCHGLQRGASSWPRGACTTLIDHSQELSNVRDHDCAGRRPRTRTLLLPKHAQRNAREGLSVRLDLLFIWLSELGEQAEAGKQSLALCAVNKDCAIKARVQGHLMSTLNTMHEILADQLDVRGCACSLLVGSCHADHS